MKNDKEDFFDFSNRGGREKRSGDSDFYKAPRPRFGCTCGTLVILLVVLFAVFVVLVVLATRYSSYDAARDAVIFAPRAGDEVAAQVEEGLKGSDGTVSVALTEAELTDLLERGGLFGARAVIQPEGIRVYGKIWGMDSDAELVPRVLENRIVFDVKAIHLGSVKVPGALGRPFTRAAEQAANDLAQDTSAIDISDIALYSGGMTITGQVVGR